MIMACNQLITRYLIWETIEIKIIIIYIKWNLKFIVNNRFQNYICDSIKTSRDGLYNIMKSVVMVLIVIFLLLVVKTLEQQIKN